MEEKGLLPPSQTGFRRGVGCMDNVYVLNYLVNRQVTRKGRRMVVLFMDMKAAFDSVDRGVLLKAMRRKGCEGRAHGEVWGSAEGDDVQGKGGGCGRGEVLDRKGGEAGLSSESKPFYPANRGHG